jgi:pimeloyl-ACP methyl ester carboxylesterase
MGGAISLQVAAARPPDALILTAPFWQLGEWWQRGIGMVLKPFLRQIRPFKKVDFFDPNIRRGIENFLPDVDLDDPNVQSEIRNFAVPLRIFEQLLRVGQAAYRLAPQVTGPILIVQGTQDETVPACRTRRLLQQLSGPVRYEEITTGHDLTRAEDPGWPDVARAVLAFTQSFAPRFENGDNVYSPIFEKTV